MLNVGISYKNYFKTMTKEAILQLADIGYSDSEIEKEIEANKKQYPTAFKKPTLALNHTSEVAIQYANDLVKYELDKADYTKQVQEVNNHNYNLDYEFQRYLEKKSGITACSEEEQNLIIEMCYEYVSRSNGTISYYQDVETFVDFVNAIKQLQK